jgi:hypothetical protein
MLRLRHIHPGGLSRLLFLEGAIAVGFLAALADLASWWSMLVLPATVALVVKLDDLVTGARRARAPAPRPRPAVIRATASVPITDPTAAVRAARPLPGGQPRRRPTTS